MRPTILPALNAVAVTLLLAACANPPAAPTSAAAVGEVRPGSGYLKGYLKPADLPDSLALVPAPPKAGSARQADDDAAFKTLTALQDTPRGQLATRDANLKFPAADQHFSCALGVKISAQTTPNLNMLLRRTLTDAGLSTYKAKNHYQRTRPFVAFNTHTCTPAEEAFLRKDGSYPSGHAALGWAWALVLTEAAPDRANALLQRGRSFGQSRAICGVHWKSDIEAGRLMGAATVARLQTNSIFEAQLAAARKEITAARAAGQVPDAATCAAEVNAEDSSALLAP